MPRGRPKGSKNKKTVSVSNSFVVIKNRPGIKKTTFNRATAERRAQLIAALTDTTKYARRAGPKLPKGGYKAYLTSIGKKPPGRPRKVAIDTSTGDVYASTAVAPKARGRGTATAKQLAALVKARASRAAKRRLPYDPSIVAPASVGRAARYIRSAAMRGIEGPMLPRGGFRALNSKARLATTRDMMAALPVGALEYMVV
jgi:hypothetical protein